MGELFFVFDLKMSRISSTVSRVEFGNCEQLIDRTRVEMVIHFLITNCSIEITLDISTNTNEIYRGHSILELGKSSNFSLVRIYINHRADPTIRFKI